MKVSKKIPLGYKLVRLWVIFFHNNIYYKKVYNLHTENIPPKGTPLVVVSNHQNSLNDALGIVLSFDVRRPHFLARADIFKKSFIAKFLYYFGLLPVYRQRDGMENVKNNLHVFDTVEDIVHQGDTIVLYPEAGHQERHFLGRFFLSYTRIAFAAAERSNFEKEIFILPCANHYNDYFNWREELVINYGTPVSIKPFYELYKEQPRQAQIQVNEIVQAQIESLMLNIKDEENYEAVYFLLQTYGRKYSLHNGYNPDKLSEKLVMEQQLVSLLETEYQQHPEQTQDLYQRCLAYKTKLKELQISDATLNKPLSIVGLTFRFLAFVLGFPFFLHGFLHHIIQYIIPRFINKKVEDKMMHASINIGVSAIVTFPLFYLLFFVLSLVFTHCFLVSFVYVMTLPLFGIIAWNYRKAFFDFMKRWRYYSLLKSNNEELIEVLTLRDAIYKQMNLIAKT